MSIKDKEKRIREERIIEATRKGLVGFEGKFGVIVSSLGKPIVSQNASAGIFSSTPINLGHEEIDDDELPVVEIHDINEPQGSEWTPKRGRRTYASLSEVGWHFDGLSRGMHMEIWYEPESCEIKVTYKGYLVYKDIKSEIQCYAPFPEWEEKIDMLFELARKIQRKNRELEKQERNEKSEKKKLTWLQRFRLQWGI